MFTVFVEPAGGAFGEAATQTKLEIWFWIFENNLTEQVEHDYYNHDKVKILYTRDMSELKYIGFRFQDIKIARWFAISCT